MSFFKTLQCGSPSFQVEVVHLPFECLKVLRVVPPERISFLQLTENHEVEMLI